MPTPITVPSNFAVSSKKKERASSPCSSSSSSRDSSNQGDTRKPSDKARKKAPKTDKSTTDTSIKDLASAKELASLKSANQSYSSVETASKALVSKARNILPMTAGSEGSVTVCPEVGGRKSNFTNKNCLKEGCGVPLGRHYLAIRCGAHRRLCFKNGCTKAAFIEYLCRKHFAKEYAFDANERFKVCQKDGCNVELNGHERSRCIKHFRQCKEKGCSKNNHYFGYCYDHKQTLIDYVQRK